MEQGLAQLVPFTGNCPRPFSVFGPQTWGLHRGWKKPLLLVWALNRGFMPAALTEALKPSWIWICRKLLSKSGHPQV